MNHRAKRKEGGKTKAVETITDCGPASRAIIAAYAAVPNSIPPRNLVPVTVYGTGSQQPCLVDEKDLPSFVANLAKDDAIVGFTVGRANRGADGFNDANAPLTAEEV